MADNSHYAFIRSLDSIGVNFGIPDGYGGVLIDSEDPHLAEGLARARTLGIKAGIWVPAGLEGGDPKEYAAKLYGLAKQYGPDLIVPDLESNVKGRPGTTQWDWHKQFVDAWKALGSQQKMAVTVMPNQDDFNYSPYTQAGIGVWAQAYGADPRTDLFDPKQVYDRLIANGVPPDMASVVLAQGQNYAGNGGAAWTLDDILADPTRSAPRWDAPPAAPSPPTAPSLPTVHPASGPGRQVDDVMIHAHPGSPEAEAYARRRLGQAVSAGVLSAIPTPGAGGYAEAWRRLSGTLAEPAQAAGYRDPGYWLRQAAQQHTLTPTNPYTSHPLIPAGVPMPAHTGPADPPSALDIARADILAHLGH